MIQWFELVLGQLPMRTIPHQPNHCPPGPKSLGLFQYHQDQHLYGGELSSWGVVQIRFEITLSWSTFWTIPWWAIDICLIWHVGCNVKINWDNDHDNDQIWFAKSAYRKTSSRGAYGHDPFWSVFEEYPLDSTRSDSDIIYNINSAVVISVVVESSRCSSKTLQKGSCPYAPLDEALR